MGDAVRGALFQAALSAGLQAWHAGNDIEAVLNKLGYARDVIAKVNDYFSASPPEDIKQSPEDFGIMPANKGGLLVKRARTVPVAKGVKKYVKRCMDNVNEKRQALFVLSQPNLTPNPTVSASFLAAIIPGTGEPERTGNQIRVLSVKVKYAMSDTIPQVGRVIVAWDRQPNGSNPAALDIVATVDLNSWYNSNNVVQAGGKRFDIIYDKRHVILPAVSGAVDYALGSSTWKGNKNVIYGGSAGTVADMVSNNLVVLGMGTGTTLDLAGVVNITYRDV